MTGPDIPPDSHMRMALEWAQESLFITSPNPRVGCVLVSEGGEVIGLGRTQMAGGAHAEVMALRDAAQRGISVRGATAYVTLEPCSHHGRTGPCCDALVAAGVRKVVASIADPNPLVGGRGFERLRAAGVEVEVGCGAKEARELNIGFFSRMIRQRPWVRLKLALSMDGYTALPDGSSQWITSAAARADGHLWRARACAVMSGVGTVLADDPLLNVRGVTTPRQPMLAVVDSQLRTPPTAALLNVERSVLIYTASTDLRKSAPLEARGASVCCFGNDQARVDLGAVLNDLATRGVNELHVEAGATLNGVLLCSGFVDELLIYMAPKLLGGGLGFAAMPSVNVLSDAVCLRYQSIDAVGEDVRLVARVCGADAF